MSVRGMVIDRPESIQYLAGFGFFRASRLREHKGFSSLVNERATLSEKYWDGTHITETVYDGWRPLAAETLNGTNRILWKRLSDSFLTYREMNANRSNLTTRGGYGLSNTAAALVPETLFDIDLNGDGAIG